MPPLAPLVEGTIFAGDFRIVRPLSQGGMGVIYVAHQLSTGRDRALKLMHPEIVAEPKMRQRFEQEARAAAGIRSDHVVQVVSAGVDQATQAPFLAMELLEGEDLGTYVRTRGPLPPTDAATIAEQLCHALGEAHALGIVHRDLKPENIFLATPRSVGIKFMVKVLDFGIAKIKTHAASALTTSPVGTPLWMAPEQTDVSSPITPATDVWALGLIVFYMLTGRVYWQRAHHEDATVMALLREILSSPLSPASQRALDMGLGRPPHGFDDWFARCVDRDPTRRFAEATSACADLLPRLTGQPADITVRGALPSEQRAATVRFDETPPGVTDQPSLSLPNAPTVPVSPGEIQGASRTLASRERPASRKPYLLALGLLAGASGVASVVLSSRDEQPPPRRADAVPAASSQPSSSARPAGSTSTTSELSRVIERERASLHRACWEKTLSSGQVAAGTTLKLTLQLSIDTGGKVQQATLSHKEGPASLATCVLGQARGWSFGPQPRPLELSVPLVFTAM